MSIGKPNIEIIDLKGLTVAKILLPEKFNFISSTILGGGFITTDNAVILQVPKNYSSKTPDRDLVRICKSLGLKGDTIGFMTAVDIKKAISISSEKIGDIEVITIITAGTENVKLAGEKVYYKPGTINILAVLNYPLNPAGLVNAVMTATEAKAAALLKLGINATGTTTDAIAIGSIIKNNGLKYAGTATDIGMALARAIIRGITDSLMKTNSLPKPKNTIEILKEWGVTSEDLWKTALSLYIPAPSWRTEDIKRMFMDKLEKIVNDINVNVIVLAASMLEKAAIKGALYDFSHNNFLSDPVNLLADEMLGLILAEYIAGIKGIFEYERYDREKPGVISKLGPFLDDIVASMVGGIMSKIYSELLGGI